MQPIGNDINVFDRSHINLNSININNININSIQINKAGEEERIGVRGEAYVLIVIILKMIKC